MTREQTLGSGTARNWNAALGKNMARWLDIALPLFMARVPAQGTWRQETKLDSIKRLLRASERLGWAKTAL
jgi:hypothetical protein